jgi:hypothetical protein
MPSFHRNEGEVRFEALTPAGVVVATFSQKPVAIAFAKDRIDAGVPIAIERVATWTQREILELDDDSSGT